MTMRTITLIIIHCSATPEGRSLDLRPAGRITSATVVSQT